MTATARRVVVHGRVQGVGFRVAMVAEARRLGVAGWVRNRADGAVEAHAEGPGDAVAALVTWAHAGPPGARVERVEEHPAAPAGGSGFAVAR